MKEKIKYGIETFIYAFITGAGLLIGMYAVQALFQGRGILKDLNIITTEMMEHICDNLCWYPEEIKDPEELECICAECKMGKFVCDIINEEAVE